MLQPANLYCASEVLRNNNHSVAHTADYVKLPLLPFRQSGQKSNLREICRAELKHKKLM